MASLKEAISGSISCSPTKRTSKARPGLVKLPLLESSAHKARNFRAVGFVIFCPCRFCIWKYNSARLKTKYVLIVMVVLAGSSVHVHSFSNVFSNATTGKFIGQGNEYLKKHDYEKARQFYDAAIAQEPTAWGPYMNRALVFIHQQKWDLALQDLNNVIRLKPGHLIAALMRGQVNTRLGNYGRALADYDRLANITASSSLTMTSAWALNARAWIRATCPDVSFRNGKQALADAKAACASTACRYAGCTDTLAAAYAEVGDFDSAIRFQQHAITQAQQEASAIKDAERRRSAYEKDIALYQRRLAGYERHQPWRSSPRLEGPILD